VFSPAGWLFRRGALDFAGGTVVHINAGIAALAAVLVIGRRRGWPQHPMPPHSLPLTLLGTGILWFGWFGFNAGSALGANGLAAQAFVNTNMAAAAAMLGWLLFERLRGGHATTLGAASGAVAGLVAITPACGWVGPMGSLVIGALAGVVCLFAVTKLKSALGYDDTLDVFGVHCIGGIVGALLTGVFAYGPLSATDASPDGSPGGVHQLWIQCQGVAATLIYSGVGTLILLMVTKALVGLRVDQEEEREGLDLVLHGEQIF
jgi:ammonium transporter, Amt family